MVYGGALTALKDIDLDFERGALTSLLGPSGCGKTTLLKIIAGLLAPTAGEVRVDGRPVTGPGPERAFVFQDFALLPWASVLRNAAFGLEMQGVPRPSARSARATTSPRSGSRASRSKYPHELSGGMRQRVGLARALAVDADVLLMDEPFSAVDEQTRRKFQEDLIKLREVEKKTFVLRHPFDRGGGLPLGPHRAACRRGRGGSRRSSIRASRAAATPRRSARDPVYLDLVDDIWRGLRHYVE